MPVSTILIVDDNAAALKATARIVEQAGYGVAQAAGGVDGLRQIRAQRPELVLLDVDLPDLSGPEVLRQVRADPELIDVAIVFLSAQKISSEDRVTGLDAGADGYISRPIAATELVARVRLHLRQQELTAQLRASETNLAAAQSIGHFGSWELELAHPESQDASPLRWSTEMYRIAGFEPGAVNVTRALFLSLVPPADRKLLQEESAAAIRERRQYSIVHRLIRPNGEERILQETARLLVDPPTGRVLKLIGMAHDITEQQRAAAEVERSNNLLRAVTDGSPDSIYVKDLQGRYLFFSEGAARLVGRPVAEVLG